MSNLKENQSKYAEFRTSLPNASKEYRQEFKNNPVKVLREYGIEIPDNMKFQVVENTDEIRHLVLPKANSEIAIKEGLVAW